MTSNRDLDEELDDIRYTIIWSVDLDENLNVERAEIYQTMDMEKVKANDWPIFVDLVQSEKYIQSALEQFRAMDWSEFKAGARDIAATSYLYKSDPDKPVCTNNQER